MVFNFDKISSNFGSEVVLQMPVYAKKYMLLKTEGTREHKKKTQYKLISMKKFACLLVPVTKQEPPEYSIHT